MTHLKHRTEDLPGPGPIEQVQRRLERAMDVFRDAARLKRESPSVEEAEAMLPQIEATLRHFPRLLADLQELDRPATTEEVAKHLSLIFIEFASRSKVADGAATLMIDRVCSKQPSLLVLDRATREIIETTKYQFIPRTADVLSELKIAQERIELITACVSEYLPNQHRELLKLIEEKKRLEAVIARRAASQLN